MLSDAKSRPDASIWRHFSAIGTPTHQRVARSHAPARSDVPVQQLLSRPGLLGMLLGIGAHVPPQVL